MARGRRLTSWRTGPSVGSRCCAPTSPGCSQGEGLRRWWQACSRRRRRCRAAERGLVRGGTDLRDERLFREVLIAGGELQPGPPDGVIRHLFERHVVPIVLTGDGVVVHAVVAAE